MNPNEKIDSVVNSVASGDSKGVQEVLTTITDPIDQSIYMEQFASRFSASKLPICELIDTNHDGSPESIKVGHLTISKVNTSEGQRLQASSDESPGVLDGAKDAVAKMVGSVSDWFDSTKLGDDLKRSNTSDSEQNRRWNRQIRQMEGAP